MSNNVKCKTYNAAEDLSTSMLELAVDNLIRCHGISDEKLYDKENAKGICDIISSWLDDGADISVADPELILIAEACGDHALEEKLFDSGFTKNDGLFCKVRRILSGFYHELHKFDRRADKERFDKLKNNAINSMNNCIDSGFKLYTSYPKVLADFAFLCDDMSFFANLLKAGLSKNKLNEDAKKRNKCELLEMLAK